jgi:Arc/MetJ family transcription regulator
MRTNIELDEELVREAQKYSSARTKRALVEDALRTLVEVRAAQRRREQYADRLRDLRLRVAGLQIRSRPLDVLDEDRNRP